MTWIYTEDAALKLKLQGLKVYDATAPAGRMVPVRYRLPEDELAALSYPIFIIEHMPVSFAPERAMRNYVALNYAPEGFPIWWPQGQTFFDPNQSPYLSYYPLPVNLDYKVTLFARKMVQHVQPLMVTLASEPYLPFQFGFLEIPQDGTARNMFLMEGPTIEYGKDNNDERLFRVVYMLRVVSEIIPTINVNGEFGSLVTQINYDFGLYASTQNLTVAEITENRALIATGPTLDFNVGPAPLNTVGKQQPEPTEQHPRRRPARGEWR